MKSHAFSMIILVWACLSAALVTPFVFGFENPISLLIMIAAFAGVLLLDDANLKFWRQK